MISSTRRRMQGAESLWGAEGGKCFFPPPLPLASHPEQSEGHTPHHPPRIRWIVES